VMETIDREPWFVHYLTSIVFIESLLITPIQRIPRYSLLLEV